MYCTLYVFIASKNKIRTFEAEKGLRNKNIEAGQNFTGS